MWECVLQNIIIIIIASNSTFLIQALFLYKNKLERTLRLRFVKTEEQIENYYTGVSSSTLDPYPFKLEQLFFKNNLRTICTWIGQKLRSPRLGQNYLVLLNKDYTLTYKIKFILIC